MKIPRGSWSSSVRERGRVETIHTYTYVYIRTHTCIHGKRLIRLPSGIIPQSYDPQCLKGKMMIVSYKTVISERTSCPLRGAGTRHSSRVAAEITLSPARRRSVPTPLKPTKPPQLLKPPRHAGVTRSRRRGLIGQAQLQRQHHSLWIPAHRLQPRGGFLHPPPQSHAQSECRRRWLHRDALLYSCLHFQVSLHICWHRATYFWYFHSLQHCIHGKYIHPAAVNHHFTMNIYLDYYCNADVLNH